MALAQEIRSMECADASSSTRIGTICMEERIKIPVAQKPKGKGDRSKFSHPMGEGEYSTRGGVSRGVR